MKRRKGAGSGTQSGNTRQTIERLGVNLPVRQVVNPRIAFHGVVQRLALLRLQHMSEPFRVCCVHSAQPDFRRTHGGEQDRSVQNGRTLVPGNLVRAGVTRYAQFGG